MRLIVRPGARVGGSVVVPGDKSIAHRWLILAATAEGSSRLDALPLSLDVCSTAACLARITGKAQPVLDEWVRKGAAAVEVGGSTWNEGRPEASTPRLEVEGEGRAGLRPPKGSLDCGNSGTSMRLLAGVLAGAPFGTVLAGDASLSTRPMERVAEPLRRMGSRIGTAEGHAPLSIEGGALHGIRFVAETASAQVKGAVLFAGLVADGATAVVEKAPTRDHTERALRALGAPIGTAGTAVTVERFQHAGFSASVPGDPSSAAFLIAAAALTGGALTIDGVGLNPTRLRFLEVFERMGVRTRTTVEREELGEPVGRIDVEAGAALRATTVEARELPLVIDEVPVLAALASHAPGDTWFHGAAELRVKESDRLRAVVSGLLGLGGRADTVGDDLMVDGVGLTGGTASAHGDHRIGMAFAVAALAAGAPCTIEGIEAADVSFPGFVPALASLGADLEAAG